MKNKIYHVRITLAATSTHVLFARHLPLQSWGWAHLRIPTAASLARLRRLPFEPEFNNNELVALSLFPKS